MSWILSIDWPSACLILADHRRLVPVPLQWVLATAAGALLTGWIIAITRSERRADRERIDSRTGFAAADAFRLEAVAHLDRRGPVSLVVLEAPGAETGDPSLGVRLAPVLRPSDLVGHLDDGRVAVLLAGGRAAANQVAARATEIGIRGSVATAESGMRTSLDALVLAAADAEATGESDDAPATDPADPPAATRRRAPRRDPESGALTRSALLRALEELMFARKLPADHAVAVVALSIGRVADDPPGPPSTDTGRPQSVDRPEETSQVRAAFGAVSRAVRPEDLVGRAEADALAVCALIHADAVDLYVESLTASIRRHAHPSGNWTGRVPVHAGYACYPPHGGTASRLVTCALAALHHAVETSGTQTMRYRDGMASVRRTAPEADEDVSGGGDRY